MNGTEIELSAVNGEAEGDAGIAHGARLLSFTEAVMAGDADAIQRERKALRAVLSDEQLVDVCATIAAFNVVDRIADATGIPLDAEMRALSVDVRRDLRLTRFASAANTPAD